MCNMSLWNISTLDVLQSEPPILSNPKYCMTSPSDAALLLGALIEDPFSLWMFGSFIDSHRFVFLYTYMHVFISQYAMVRRL